MKNIDINKISVYKETNRTKIKYIKRCEICNFASLDLLNNSLVCVQDYKSVEKEELCNLFKLDKKFKNEMIDKCVEVIK